MHMCMVSICICITNKMRKVMIISFAYCCLVIGKPKLSNSDPHKVIKDAKLCQI